MHLTISMPMGVSRSDDLCDSCNLIFENASNMVFGEKMRLVCNIVLI